MPDPIACLLAVLAAACASALCVLVAGATGRRPVSGARPDVACIVALAAGLLAGYAVLRFQPELPPASALDRFLTIVLPAAIGVELVATIARVPRGLVAALRTVLALAIGRVLLHGSVYLKGATNDAPWQSIVAIALGGAVLAAEWVLLRWLDRRVAGAVVAMALSESLVCGGLAIMLNGYLAGGEAALPPAAALAGAALATAAITPRDSIVGAIGLGVVTLFSLLFIGRFFGALPTWQALAVLLSPFCCWAGELRLLQVKTSWVAAMIRLGLVAVPLIVVLAVAKHDFDRKMTPLLTVVQSPPCIATATGL